MGCGSRPALPTTESRMKPTRANAVRAILKADPVTPLSDLARANGFPPSLFVTFAHRVTRTDGIDYHAQRLDGRKRRTAGA
jgi:hypothetical protein